MVTFIIFSKADGLEIEIVNVYIISIALRRWRHHISCIVLEASIYFS